MPFKVDLYRDYLVVLGISEVFASLVTNNTSGVLKRGFLREGLKVFALDLISIGTATLILYGAHSGIDYSRLLTLYTSIYFGVLDLIFRTITI